MTTEMTLETHNVLFEVYQGLKKNAFYRQIGTVKFGR